MAVLKMTSKQYYKEAESVETLIRYITNPSKTNDQYISGIGIFPYCSVEKIILQFQTVKEVWHKTDGVQLLHFIVSFDQTENVNPYQAFLLSHWIAGYFSNGYQVVYAVHQDSDNVHVHFVVNTVSCMDGHKMNRGIDDYYALGSHVRTCLHMKQLWDGTEDSRIKDLVLVYEND